MEDHPRGDSDQRDPVLVYEALELRFCVCLVCEIAECQNLIKIVLISRHVCMSKPSDFTEVLTSGSTTIPVPATCSIMVHR